MKLLELFDNPYDWTFEDGERLVKYVINSDYRPLVLKFMFQNTAAKNRVADWDLYLYDEADGDVPRGQSKGRQDEMFRVWATAIECVIHFLEHKKPDGVSFSGSTPELTRLYTHGRATLEERIASTGYFVDVETDRRTGAPLFVIRKDESQ